MKDFGKENLKKEYLISNTQDKIHPKKYTEGKWIKKYVIEKIKYLEWGTKRSPKKLVRPTFSELYTPPKIMMGGMTGAILDNAGLFCNHSITVSVLWKDFEKVKNRSIEGSIKKDFKIVGKVSIKRKELEENSKNFDLKYLLAILNSKFGYYALSQNRRSQIGFYPDDLKKLPIKKISKKQQKPFIDLVDKILNLTKSSDYLQHKSKQEKVQEYERQMNEMVYELYGLTEEDREIVENSSKK